MNRYPDPGKRNKKPLGRIAICGQKELPWSLLPSILASQFVAAVVFAEPFQPFFVNTNENRGYPVWLVAVLPSTFAFSRRQK